MTLVILAAGIGRRFGGPKQLAPVGPSGQAIMDYSVYDALAAGFSSVVLVIRSEIEGAIATHLRQSWPDSLPFELVCQDRLTPIALQGRHKPLGTAHAVLVSRGYVEGPFAVINADDLYGPEPYQMLKAHLSAKPNMHVLVGFRLDRSFLGRGPVSRAVLQVSGDGNLIGISERNIERTDENLFASSRAGKTGYLHGNALVSTNMWGFQASAYRWLQKEYDAFVSSEPVPHDDEIMLPDAVSSMVHDAAGEAVKVITAPGRCIGVTHPGDLERVRADIGSMVAEGLYPEPLWER